MIFVTFGTQPHDFKFLASLVNQIDPNQKIICQIGHSKNIINHQNCQVFDFVDNYDELVKSCDILLTHSGVGSIMSGLEASKKVIAVSRLQRENEHNDDHQLEIANKLMADNYIYHLERNQDINAVIEEVSVTNFKSYPSNTNNFITHLVTLLEEYNDSSNV